MAGMSSIKRSLIVKSNSTIVAVTSGACFIVVFCLVASASLVNQLTYQNRIITADNTALNQLNNDIHATQNLENAYNAFVGTPINIIGGNPNGTGVQDGMNSKIILDALPSTYDYPALATSLESILTSQGVQIESITGTDETILQTSQSSSNPSPQPMPFQVIVQGNYASIQNVINAFERSVRPFQIQTMELSGDQSQLNLNITANTYWQPAKSLNISTEVIK
jgi:Tfp pilus assembly protein PilO